LFFVFVFVRRTLIQFVWLWLKVKFIVISSQPIFYFKIMYAKLPVSCIAEFWETVDFFYALDFGVSAVLSTQDELRTTVSDVVVMLYFPFKHYFNIYLFLR
jgi:hypothetical protein